MSFCNYRDCNKNSRKNREEGFFRFPKDPEMRKKWVENSGCDPSILDNFNSNFFICSDHFLAECRFGKFLIAGTTPLPYQMCEPQSAQPTVSPTDPVNEIVGTDVVDSDEDVVYLGKTSNFDSEKHNVTSLVPQSPVVNQRKRKNDCLVNKIMSCPKCVNQSDRIQEKRHKLAEIEKELQQEYSKGLAFQLKKDDTSLEQLSETGRLLVAQMQLRAKGKWTDSEKDLALVIYGASPTCYNMMRNVMQLSLPPPRDLEDFMKITPAPKDTKLVNTTNV